MIALVIVYGLIGVLLWICVVMAVRDRQPAVMSRVMLWLLLPVMAVAWPFLIMRSLWR